MTKMKDKIVFITGASSGIGKACTRAFAAEGANLIIAARRISKLNEFAVELKNKYQVKVKTLELDVRNRKRFTMQSLLWKKNGRMLIS